MRTLILILFSMNILYGQPKPIEQQLFDYYDQIKEPSIQDRRFKHRDIQPLIHVLKKNDQFQVRKLGESIEGREISMISMGNGPESVLLWSQMHGNEPTATMALMDIFRFFAEPGPYEELKKTITENLSLHFIPMLNPDGAEHFGRRNALGVDLNRDALRLQNPESQILKAARDSLDADWGFNLHDQSRYYAAGLHPKTASISFLAPAYNYEKEVNESRANAMRLIGNMNAVLQQYIEGKVARYNDDFEPRAFGDNIQKWGTSTILIESGGLVDDREKQYLRKLHFVALMTAFRDIAEKKYVNTPLDQYEQIPFNKSNRFHDLIIRQAQVEKNGQAYTVDIGIRQQEIAYDQYSQFYLQAIVQDLGDLSTSYGYREQDMGDYACQTARVYPRTFRNVQQWMKADPAKLIESGFVVFKLKKMPPAWEIDRLPVQLVHSKNRSNHSLGLGRNACLIFSKEDQIEYILVNGFLNSVEAAQKQLIELKESGYF